MKHIRLSKHAEEQIFFRGSNEAEVILAIETTQWKPLKSGRAECRKDFVFEKEWNKVYYKIKQVRPIFIEEENEIVVITVYTYFF